MSTAAVLLILFSLAVGGCSRFDMLNATVPSLGYTRTTDLSYGDLPRQKLDVYQPPGATSAPVVIFFYGGDWQNGSKSEYRFAAQALVSRGFVTVMPDYRLLSGSGFPGVRSGRGGQPSADSTTTSPSSAVIQHTFTSWGTPPARTSPRVADARRALSQRRRPGSRCRDSCDGGDVGAV